MAEKRRRGRPKGTGIDDVRRLQDIARLLVVEPGLKPTTAIRSLGHSNPSVIRRLRDKLSADFDRLIATARRDLGITVTGLAPAPAFPHKATPSGHVVAHKQAEQGNAPRLQVTRKSIPLPGTASRQTGYTPETHDRDGGTAAYAPSPAASARNRPQLTVVARAPVVSSAKTVAQPAPRPDEALYVDKTLHAAAVAMRDHLQLCKQVAHVPGIAAFIRQQMFLTELILGVGIESLPPSSTRH